MIFSIHWTLSGPCCQASGSHILEVLCQWLWLTFVSVRPCRNSHMLYQPHLSQGMSSSTHEAVPRGMLYFHTMLIGLLDAQGLLLDLLPGAMILWFSLFSCKAPTMTPDVHLFLLHANVLRLQSGTDCRHVDLAKIKWSDAFKMEHLQGLEDIGHTLLDVLRIGILCSILIFNL